MPWREKKHSRQWKQLPLTSQLTIKQVVMHYTVSLHWFKCDTQATTCHILAEWMKVLKGNWRDFPTQVHKGRKSIKVRVIELCRLCGQVCLHVCFDLHLIRPGPRCRIKNNKKSIDISTMQKQKMQHGNLFSFLHCKSAHFKWVISDNRFKPWVVTCCLDLKWHLTLPYYDNVKEDNTQQDQLKMEIRV